jgi:3-hydroxybutyryl-CoA dehydrogenase
VVAEAATAGTPHVAVVGAGAMGAQIAHVCALAGCTVTLLGRDLERVRAGSEKAAGVLRKRVEKGKMSPEHLDVTLGRLAHTADHATLAEADIIIESVAEDRDTKRHVLRAIAEHASPAAVIASNSSTLPSSLFADVIPEPSRLLNLHFFNPALVLPLVEVVKGPHTTEATMVRAVDFVRLIGKTPVRVEKESPGFIVNRILFLAMREAFQLVEDGYVSMDACDDAVKRALSWPMGPFELADLVGLDITEAILREGAQQSGEERWAPPRILTERVARGDLGTKTGRGFYERG